VARYTPGYTDVSVAFMAARTVEEHGAFFAPHLRPGAWLLDCGCGPGSITLGLARLVAPGGVIGVDREPSQVAAAVRAASGGRGSNARFLAAEADRLPFADASFDAVFSHALLEHLADPVGALREFRRVLRPAGRVGVCSPDWDGFVLAPDSAEVRRALAVYAGMQRSNGGDPGAGRRLGDHLAEAGFTGIVMSARYECYADRHRIAEYLAHNLEASAHDGGEDRAWAAQELRSWARRPYGLFAQCWVAATAAAPPSPSPLPPHEIPGIRRDPGEGEGRGGEGAV
jgi:SAM-dependent methyltransferase